MGFSETEIVYANKQVEAGVPVVEVARKYGVSDKTIYEWRRRYGGLTADELPRLKQLEEEYRKLKQVVAELSLDEQKLQEVLRKKAPRPAEGRESVEAMTARHEVSERRACRALGFPRSTNRYRGHRDPAVELRARLRELAVSRHRYGLMRLYVPLLREGWPVNHKRVLRLYREEGLMVRTKRRRKLTSRIWVLPPLPKAANEHWSLDFVSGQLSAGQRFRALTAVDHFTRECLCAEAGFHLRSESVTRALDAVLAERGEPRVTTLDNGTEFTASHFG